MKNGLVIWNILLTAIAGYLLIAQFGKKKEPAAGTGNRTITDSLGAPSIGAGRIAYFEMDSIEANFEMVKDVKGEIEAKQKLFSDELSQLELTGQRKIQEYRNKGAAATQEDMQRFQVEMKQLEDNAKARRQQMDQEYQDYVTRRNLKVRSTIEEFVAKYNANKHYAYIVAYESGLFYYKDSTLNITSDVLKGLNAEYKKAK